MNLGGLDASLVVSFLFAADADEASPDVLCSSESTVFVVGESLELRAAFGRFSLCLHRAHSRASQSQVSIIFFKQLRFLYFWMNFT